MLADIIFNSLDVIYIIKDKNNKIIRTNNPEYLKILKDLPINDNIVTNPKTNKCYEYKQFDYTEQGIDYIVEIYNDTTKYQRSDINNIDFTTKLFNKQFTFEQLDKYLLEANKNDEFFTIAMADIDFFKNINDTYGHLAGDKILKKIGETFIRNTRNSDIVGRFGGEEFVILLKNISLENSKSKLENIRKEIENLIVEYEGKTINNITVSIGAVYYDNFEPINQSSLENARMSLIEKADQSLYYTKENGRNQVAFYNSL